jgi:hypothetical protein
MPSTTLSHLVGHAAQRVPGLRRLPVLRLLVLGEIALLARDHVERLSPKERHRFVVLLREARGRPSTLSSRKHAELQALVAKAEPQLFARVAADKLSPIPLPGRSKRRS